MKINAMSSVVSATEFCNFLNDNGFVIVRKAFLEDDAGEADSGQVTDELVKKQIDRARRLQEQLKVEAAVGNPQLVASLKQWRRERAKQENVAPFIILGNMVLYRIVETCPATLEELAAVKGFGASRAAKYGAQILDIVAREMEVVEEL